MTIDRSPGEVATGIAAASLMALAAMTAACGPGHGKGAAEPGDGNSPVAGGADDGGQAEARAALNEKTFAELFETGQSASYLEWEGTVWLVVKLTQKADPAEILGHLFGVVANRFDFENDQRLQLVLIAYKGPIKERDNYGIRVSMEAMAMLQKGEMTIDEVTEEAGYILKTDISALEPLLVNPAGD